MIRSARLQKLAAIICAFVILIAVLLALVELKYIKGSGLPVVLIVFCILYIGLIFFIMEYYYYRKWYKTMHIKLGKKFDDRLYSFRPIFSVKRNAGDIVQKSTVCTIYEKGIKANFLFGKHKSVLWEFKGYDEISAIYPIRFSSSKGKRYDGIQIETSDLKVGVFSTKSAGTLFPKIVRALLVQLDDKWDKLFKKNSVLIGKQIGVHHSLPKIK